MSTDPSKQPLPTSASAQDDPSDAAAPTVRAPAQPAGWGSEPPTRPVPQWPAPPPPPPGPRQDPPRQDPPRHDATRHDATRQDPPPAAPTTRSPVEQPTVLDAAPPTQWDRPPRQQPQQPQQPQQWQQPQRQQEPQDSPPRSWSQEPPAPPGQRPPAQPPVGGPPRQVRKRRRRRVRRSVMALFTVIVLLILLVIGDRVALAITENDMASQFQSNGLPVKPSVTIEGFPFLTQLIAKDFNKVDISASNVPVPLPTGGDLSITSLHATINGLHISSYSSTASARVDHMTAAVFVSFNSIAAAGGIGGGTGITMSPVNANTVKITASLAGLVSDSEEARITVTGPQTITVKVLPSDGALGSVLSSFGSFSFNLPKGVPPGLKITNLSLNSQGVTASAAATNATFSQ